MIKEAENSALTEEMVARICKAIDPDAIILFGSRGRGDARPGSDYDLLVIKDSTKPRYKRSAPLYRLLADLPVEVDILVYTPEEVAEWKNVSQAFVMTALNEGRTLYERQA